MDKSIQTFTSQINTEGIVGFKNMTVKVLIQKSSKKILLAHCTEDFIDFLFSFLAVPLGRVIRMLSKEDGPASCVKNIHQSLSELSVGEYLKSQQTKDMLVCPQFAMLYLFTDQLFKNDKYPKLHVPPESIGTNKWYLSSYCSSGYRELRL